MVYVKFEFSFDDDYAHYRYESTGETYDFVQVWAKVEKGKVICNELRAYAPNKGIAGKIIAEQRPDRLWYTSRDWDAKGFDRWTVYQEQPKSKESISG